MPDGENRGDVDCIIAPLDRPRTSSKDPTNDESFLFPRSWRGQLLRFGIGSSVDRLGVEVEVRVVVVLCCLLQLRFCRSRGGGGEDGISSLFYLSLPLVRWREGGG